MTVARHEGGFAFTNFAQGTMWHKFGIAWALAEGEDGGGRVGVGVFQMPTMTGLLCCVSPFKHSTLRPASNQETPDSPPGKHFPKHKISNK